MKDSDKELLESLQEGDESPVLDLSKDIFGSKFKVISEEATSLGKGVLARIAGVLMGPFDEENGNGRDYSKEVAIQGILESEYVKRQMGYKTLLGEPHHPADRYEIWSNEVSHSVVEMHMSEDNKYLMGTLDILDTPSGNILKTLVDYGCTLGVSARASGKTRKKNGRLIVVPEAYNFKTFDVVLNPGFVEARLSVVNEEVSESQGKDVAKLVEELIESGTEKDIATAKSVIEYCGDEKLKALLPDLTEGKSDNSVGDVDRQIDELNEELEAVCKERNQYKAEAKQLSLQVNALQARLKREQVVSQETEIQESLEALKRTLTCRESSIKQLKDDNESLKSGLNEAIDYVELLVMKLKDISESKERMSGEIQALKESLTEVKVGHVIDRRESKNVGLANLVESKADVNVLNEENNGRIVSLVKKLGGK